MPQLRGNEPILGLNSSYTFALKGIFAHQEMRGWIEIHGMHCTKDCWNKSIEQNVGFPVWVSKVKSPYSL
jgi:hypothetical protein